MVERNCLGHGILKQILLKVQVIRLAQKLFDKHLLTAR